MCATRRFPVLRLLYTSTSSVDVTNAKLLPVGLAQRLWRVGPSLAYIVTFQNECGVESARTSLLNPLHGLIVAFLQCVQPTFHQQRMLSKLGRDCKKLTVALYHLPGRLGSVGTPPGGYNICRVNCPRPNCSWDINRSTGPS